MNGHSHSHSHSPSEVVAITNGHPHPHTRNGHHQHVEGEFGKIPKKPIGVSHGEFLRATLEDSGTNPLPFIGVFDAFSAAIAGRSHSAIFLSGFGFSASFYGLPDIGYISWSDIVAYVHRVRTILPHHHILVDIDDGYCDIEVACHVVSLLEAAGASGVVLEDQKRPRKCGHLAGKQIMEMDDYIVKLKKVLATRSKLFVIARTDASDPEDIRQRIHAFAEAGADGLLVDGVTDVRMIQKLVNQVKEKHPNKYFPFAFNQMAGGKSPALNLHQLEELGVKMVIYSTPCLFAAQEAMVEALHHIFEENGGKLPQPTSDDRSSLTIGVKQCNSLLHANLQNRDAK